LTSQSCLRGHLARLEEQNLLLRVKKQVKRGFEIAALIKKASKLGKAIFFENVKGNHAVAANVAGSHRMLAMALGLEPDGFLQKFDERTSKSYKAKLVNTGSIQEIVATAADVSKLPLLTHFERD
jgi:UbiD family decarboxylase